MFIPSKENCKVRVRVIKETEKAYGCDAGGVQSSVRGKGCCFVEWIAKSICYVEDGKVYAPIWATRDIPFDCKDVID